MIILSENEARAEGQIQKIKESARAIFSHCLWLKVLDRILLSQGGIVKFQIWILVLAFFVSPLAGSTELMVAQGNRYIRDFSEAKKKLHKIFSDHQVTLYCGCKYYGKEVNLNSCQSASPGQNSRFKKLEWEHVVPADKMGEVVKSWSQEDLLCQNRKGRKCAAKASPLFRQMEGDMYNLWPESGGINGARSNKPPVESVSGPVTRFGQCETVVGKHSFAPRKQARGEVARAYLYMHEVYGIPLSKNEISMFQNWHQQDPVDSWECERGRRIQKIQGNPNRLLEASCRGLQL